MVLIVTQETSCVWCIDDLWHIFPHPFWTSVQYIHVQLDFCLFYILIQVIAVCA